MTATSTLPANDSIAALGRGIRTVVVCLTLGIVIGAAYVLLVPKRYVAVSSLLIGTPSANGTAGDGSLDAEAELIRSSEVLRLADKDGVLGQTVAKGVDPVPVVKRCLQVTVVAQRRQINVSYASTNRADAIRVVDVVVEAYRSYQSDQKDRHARGLADAVQATRHKVDAQLAEAREALAKFDAAGTTAAGGPAAAARVNSLADALTKAQLDTFAARRTYDEAVAAAGPSLGNLDDKQLETALNDATANAPDSVEMVAQEAAALSRQLEELGKTFAQNHPIVVRTSQRLQQLRLTLVAGARQRWQATQAREEGLKKSFDGLQKDATGTATRTAERERLVAEVTRYQTQLDDLDRQVNQALLTTAVGAMSVQVDAPAEVDNPNFPPIPRATPTLMTAGLIGLALGGLFALIGEFRKGDFLQPTRLSGPDRRTTGQVGESLELPVLATIPEADPDTAGDAIAWASRDDAFGPIANAVRSLRRTIEVEGRLPASVLLTSAADGQGTTALALNLAATIAQERRKVLLVDLNFRAPRVAALANVPGERGLAELLADGDPIDLIRTTTTPRLDVLPAGATPADAATLLNSDQFVALLGMLTSAYDHVIFDAPSLARGEDARIVASLCDGTVLVARRSMASLKRAAGARDMLLMIGANLLGVVLNRSYADASSRAPGRGDTAVEGSGA